MIYENEEDENNYKIEYLGEKFSKNVKVYKIINVGQYGVGKTSIIHRLVRQEFDKEYVPTMSIDIKNFQVKVNDKIIQIQIWDCCGNDKYAQGIPNLFKNISIVILVYAINDKRSFRDLTNWYNIIKDYSLDTSIVLIGNKNDLENEREVTIEDVKAFRENYDSIKIFLETSALTGENMDKILEKIVILIYKNEINDESKFESRIILSKEDFTKARKKKKKKFC